MIPKKLFFLLLFFFTPEKFSDVANLFLKRASIPKTTTIFSEI